MGFAPWGWVIGSGIYIDDVEAKFRADAVKLLLWGLGIGGFIAISLLLLSRNIIRTLGGDPSLASAITRRIASGDLATPVDCPADDKDSLLANIRTMLKSQLEGGLSHLFHRNIHRAMAMIARRQLLAYRAYAAPSATSWQSLHDLYQLVRGPLNTPLNGETAPIEHEYVGALLFAYLEPSKLPRSELDTIHACSRQLAAYATIGDALADPAAVKHPDSCFLVRPDEAAPGYPLSRLPASVSTFGGLLVDCSQVLAALDRNLTRRPGKAVEPDLNAAPAMKRLLSSKPTKPFGNSMTLAGSTSTAPNK